MARRCFYFYFYFFDYNVVLFLEMANVGGFDDAVVSSISSLSDAVSIEPPSDPDLIKTATDISLRRLETYIPRRPSMTPQTFSARLSATYLFMGRR